MDFGDWSQTLRRIRLLRQIRQQLAQGRPLQVQTAAPLLVHAPSSTLPSPALPSRANLLHELEELAPSLGQAGRRLVAAAPDAVMVEVAEGDAPGFYAAFRHPLFRWLALRVAQPLTIELGSDRPQTARLRLAELPAPVRLRVAGPTWTLHDAGGREEATVRRWLTRTLLFVCTGNTCRSPLAELLCKQHLAERLGCRPEQLPTWGWVIGSAGLAADRHAPASTQAQAVARQRGLSLEAHRSRPVEEAAPEQADLLVALTAGHRQGLHWAYPESPVRLLHAAGRDIADPYGGSRETYAACAAEIEQQVRLLVEELLRHEETPRIARSR